MAKHTVRIRASFELELETEKEMDTEDVVDLLDLVNGDKAFDVGPDDLWLDAKDDCVAMDLADMCDVEVCIDGVDSSDWEAPDDADEEPGP